MPNVNSLNDSEINELNKKQDPTIIIISIRNKLNKDNIILTPYKL